MKYFTMEWWAGDSSAATGDEYYAYIQTIRPGLAPDLIALLDTVHLHDSKVHHFMVRIEQKDATLLLKGFVNPWTPEGCEIPRRISLRYNDLRAVEIIKPEEDPPDIEDNTIWIPQVGEPIDRSDLGYDELEVLPDGRYEHRMLFASGIELKIQFGSLTLTFVDESERPNNTPKGIRLPADGSPKPSA